MNQKIKQKLIDTLESGQYKHGTTYLKTDDHYCILGVLYEVIEGPDAWEEAFCLDRGTVYQSKRGEIHFLCPVYLADHGIEEKEMYVLVEVNDSHSDFSEVIRILKEEM